MLEVTTPVLLLVIIILMISIIMVMIIIVIEIAKDRYGVLAHSDLRLYL